MPEEKLIETVKPEEEKGFFYWSIELLKGAALGPAALAGIIFLANNFSHLVESESAFFRGLLQSKSGVMAMAPAAAAVPVIVVIIACIISILLIQYMWKRMVTMTRITITRVTTPVTTSVWGFVKWLFITVISVVVTIVQIFITVLMLIVIIINIAAVFGA
jgi:hypothetical protein